MKTSPREFLPLVSALLVAAGVLVSCRTVSFYVQAARGQRQILSGAKPIETVLQDPATPAELRKKLELVQELRRFAANRLMLPAHSQYDRYADLGRKCVVWVVYAAPEFSVEAKTWRYPLVGTLKYRGFFRELDAKREAAQLRREGFDVHVAGTEAYSTLGWLRDPVLNTFLHRSDALLAELVFHELTHQKLYLAGDTDFNEAFATAMGEEGARRWLRSKGRLKELQNYEAEKCLQRDVVTAVLNSRSRLSELYEKSAGETLEKRRELKRAELLRLHEEARRLRVQHGLPSPVDKESPKLPNNASMNGIAAYYVLLPGFERLLAEAKGDLAGFFQRVEGMKVMSRQQRRDLLMGEPAPRPGKRLVPRSLERSLTQPMVTPKPKKKKPQPPAKPAADAATEPARSPPAKPAAEPAPEAPDTPVPEAPRPAAPETNANPATDAGAEPVLETSRQPAIEGDRKRLEGPPPALR